jgi:hypothetical protein
LTVGGLRSKPHPSFAVTPIVYMSIFGLNTVNHVVP